MGKLAKVFLCLVFILGLGLPPVAVKIRDMMQEQGEEISQLETEVKNTKEELQTAEDEKESLEEDLDVEKKRKSQVKRELDSTTQQLSRVKDEFKKKESDLNSCVVEKGRLRQDLTKLQQEKSTLEEKISKQTEEMNALKESLTTKKVFPDTGVRKQRVAGPVRGRVAGIYGGRFITISLSTGIEDVTLPIFVHRKGKVLGKVSLDRVHGATLVMELMNTELLEKIGDGDIVELEGEKLLKPELFEGRISKVSQHGFVSIEVNRRSYVRELAFTVYKGDNPVGRIESKKVTSLVIVAELGNIKPGMRIEEKDNVRTPR